MAQIYQQPAQYRFGVFELDPSSGDLRKFGVKLKLQEQPLQVLLLLLERPGQVVSREDIQRRLWPEKTFVDFENAINSAVRKLRDALSDSAENPRFVETVARRGYRFVAPVHVPTEPVAAPVVIQPKRQFGTHPLVAAIAGASIAVLIAAGSLWQHDGRPTRTAEEDVLPPAVPLTSYPGFQREPAFSPEGSRVAFAWDEPGKRASNIYVKLVGSSGEPQRLTTGESDDFGPAWSRDGRYIAFLRSRGPEEAGVVLIPSVGGAERELARLRLDTTQFTFHSSWCLASPLLAWSSDGKWLLAPEQLGAKQPEYVRTVRISVETGEETPIELFHDVTSGGNQANVSLRSGESGLALSPDGRNLAFTHMSDWPIARLFLIPLSPDMLPRGSAHVLHLGGSFIPGIGWDPNGQSVVVPSDRRGRAEIWRVPVHGDEEPKRLNISEDDPGEVAISQTGQRLVFTHYSADDNIWRLDLKSHHLSGMSSFISSTAVEGDPSYSSDGKRIAFASARSGVREIWTSNADGSQPVQLTFFGSAWSGTPRWSPDDQHIAFDSNISGRWNIYRVASEGGKPVRLTPGEGSSLRPSWSHDGNWIYYCSPRTSGPQVLKIPVAGGTAVQVTKNGGCNQMESPDGKYVYYLNDNSRALWRVSVADGNETQVFAVRDELTFAMGRSGVYVASPHGVAATTLRILNVASGAVTTVGTIPLPVFAHVSVSPDEHWFAFVKTDLSRSQLMLVENFR